MTVDAARAAGERLQAVGQLGELADAARVVEAIVIVDGSGDGEPQGAIALGGTRAWGAASTLAVISPAASRASTSIPRRATSTSASRTKQM